jgi:RNA polymerase sigma-70 factor (ECF subfamily)
VTQLTSDQSKSIPAIPNGTADDLSLVRKALIDPAAFAHLFDRYWDAIFGFCYLRVGDWHEAEDVASQVFVNALASLPRFQADNPGQSFRAWLFGIARNLVGTSWRERHRHSTAPLDLASNLPDDYSTPDELLLAQEQHERLLTLLAQLPSDQRELLELRLAGLTAAEIGNVLGRTETAIRKAQSRTVIGLRAAVAAQDAHDRGPYD